MPLHFYKKSVLQQGKPRDAAVNFQYVVCRQISSECQSESRSPLPPHSLSSVAVSRHTFSICHFLPTRLHLYNGLAVCQKHQATLNNCYVCMYVCMYQWCTSQTRPILSLAQHGRNHPAYDGMNSPWYEQSTDIVLTLHNINFHSKMLRVYMPTSRGLYSTPATSSNQVQVL